jgi:hypothetical protein
MRSSETRIKVPGRPFGLVTVIKRPELFCKSIMQFRSLLTQLDISYVKLSQKQDGHLSLLSRNYA